METPNPQSPPPETPHRRRRAAALAILLSAIIGVVLTAAITQEVQNYGLALFVLVPIVVGFLGAAIRMKISPSSYGRVIGGALIGLLVTALLLLLVALEGAICLLMAAPLAIPLAVGGATLAWMTGKGGAKRYLSIASVAMLALPVPLSLLEKGNPVLDEELVRTRIHIEADPMTVWRQVHAPMSLPQPEGKLFRIGLGYPQHSVIENENGCEVIRWTFSTGQFVKPVTEAIPGKLLAYDVSQSAPPMRELNFWPVDPPHLHGFFETRRGQYLLESDGHGGTWLEGSTWYVHNIRPVPYWSLWSDKLIDMVHTQVLQQVKVSAEREALACR
jgi:hypothetical protein